jgi:hypothetical protein
MEEIIHRIKMNCPHLTTIDLSKVEDKWIKLVLKALETNTNIKKIKVKTDEKRFEWLRISNNLEVYFVDNFIAIDGEDVIYHIYKPSKFTPLQI